MVYYSLIPFCLMSEIAFGTTVQTYLCVICGWSPIPGHQCFWNSVVYLTYYNSEDASKVLCKLEHAEAGKVLYECHFLSP